MIQILSMDILYSLSEKSKFQNLCFPSDVRLWIKFLVEDKTFDIHQSKVLERKLVNAHLEVKIQIILLSLAKT